MKMDAREIDQVNEYTIFKVAEKDKFVYLVKMTDEKEDSTGKIFSFNSLSDAVDFCEKKTLILLTVSKDGTDSTRRYYVLGSVKEFWEKITELTKGIAMPFEVTEALVEHGVYKFPTKGYLCIGDYKFGDAIGKISGEKYLKECKEAAYKANKKLFI